jgi:hypothetical protein
MFVDLTIFLIFFIYIIGCICSIPLCITYSNNFYSFEEKNILFFIIFFWILFVLLFLIILSDYFIHPIKVKNKFNKFFQFKYVHRNEMGFRISNEY